MAIKSTGPLKFSEIQSEFGGSDPIRMSEYYRNGRYVTPNNSNVPTSGEISVSKLRGGVGAKLLKYEAIGGGGTGGSGRVDGHSSSYRAPSGENTTITAAGISGYHALNSAGNIVITGYGALGGIEGNIDMDVHAASLRNGKNSHYGTGGKGGGYNAAGSPPAATAYGAGGGGAGGDDSSWNDHSGGGGSGGLAANRVAGEILLVPNTVVTVVVGNHGGNSTRYRYTGARGASGYARLELGNQVWEFDTAGTHTFTVPS